MKNINNTCPELNVMDYALLSNVLCPTETLTQDFYHNTRSQWPTADGGVKTFEYKIIEEIEDDAIVRIECVSTRTREDIKNVSRAIKKYTSIYTRIRGKIHEKFARTQTVNYGGNTYQMYA